MALKTSIGTFFYQRIHDPSNPLIKPSSNRATTQKTFFRGKISMHEIGMLKLIPITSFFFWGKGWWKSVFVCRFSMFYSIFQFICSTIWKFMDAFKTKDLRGLSYQINISSTLFTYWKSQNIAQKENSTLWMKICLQWRTVRRIEMR